MSKVKISEVWITTNSLTECANYPGRITGIQRLNNNGSRKIILIKYNSSQSDQNESSALRSLQPHNL